MAAELAREAYAEVTLIEGGRGIFDVRAEGKLIFSKQTAGRFPDAGEVLSLVRDDFE